MLKSNFHTHTTFCDGSNSIEEMIQAAIDLNFHTIGFSIHSPMFFENDWACNKDNLPKYIAEIKRLQNKYQSQIAVSNGIELDADFTDCDINEFDYVIAAMHQLRPNKIDRPEIDLSSDCLIQAVNKYYDGNWMAMAKSYYSDFSEFIIKIQPDVVAHFDLIQKFNENAELFNSKSPEYKLIVQLYLERIIMNCPNVIFEINTGAMYRCGNLKPYPSSFIMKILKKHNMKIAISSDSHNINSINYAFDDALEYCKKYGFEEIQILNGTKFVPYKI